MPPIGFVVLTHSNPPQITRLIRCLNALYSSPPIVLHHDFSQCRCVFVVPLCRLVALRATRLVNQMTRMTLTCPLLLGVFHSGTPTLRAQKVHLAMS